MKHWTNICTTCAIIITSAILASGQKKYSFKLTVNYQEAKKGDTLCLYPIGPYDYDSSLSDKNSEKKIKSALDEAGNFHFDVSSSVNIGYYAIGQLHAPERPFAKSKAINLAKTLVPERTFESGDEVVIKISKKQALPSYETFDPKLLYNYSYSGRGSQKFWLADKLDSLCRNLNRYPVYFDENTDLIMTDQSAIKSIEGYVKSNSNGVSENAEALMLIDALSNISSVSLTSIRVAYEGKKANNQRGALQKIKASFVLQANEAFSISNQPNATLYTCSNAYIRYQVKRHQLESFMETGEKDASYVFDKIMSTYTGELREKMATFSLYNSFGSKDFDRQLSQLLGIAKNDESRKILFKLQTRKGGQSIPDFMLIDRQGNCVSTSQFRGKIIIMDFWFTGCGACMWTFEHVMSKVERDFQKNDNVVFLSISVDEGRVKWQSGIDSGKYTSDDAINVYTGGMGTAHPVINHFNIKGFPTLIVIDHLGKIASYNDQSFVGNDGAFFLRGRINELLNNI